MKESIHENNRFKWSKFAGLASQWAIALVVFMMLGKFIDSKHFFKTNMPLFIWILPFVFIVFSLVNIIKETDSKLDSNNNNDHSSYNS